MGLQIVIFLISIAASLALRIPHINQGATYPETEFRLLLNPSVMQQSPAAIAAQPQESKYRFTPTAVYIQKSIHSFTVLIHPEVLTHQQTAEEMQRELDQQLLAISQVVPTQPLSALRKVRIWVEWAKRPQGAAEFHPSAQWLSQNGYNPEKAGCVEVSNTRNFVQWSRSDQPWMLLHELAHAYHHRVLGDQYPPIEAAYRQAINHKLYASVHYIKGGNRKAYALTNAKEYFAELSESYFGKNDFYPFIRSELKTYDPVGYQLMEKAWGKPRKRRQVAIKPATDCRYCSGFAIAQSPSAQGQTPTASTEFPTISSNHLSPPQHSLESPSLCGVGRVPLDSHAILQSTGLAVLAAQRHDRPPSRPGRSRVPRCSDPGAAS